MGIPADVVVPATPDEPAGLREKAALLRAAFYLRAHSDLTLSDADHSNALHQIANYQGKDLNKGRYGSG